MDEQVDASPTVSSDDLFARYRDKIGRIAAHWATRYRLTSRLDELVSAGCEGLYEAWERRDPARKNEFWTYADGCVVGKIRDEVRRMGALSRRAHAAHQAYNDAAHRTQPAPADADARARAELAVRDLVAGAAAFFAGYSLAQREPVEDSPEASAIASELNGSLREALTALTEQQRTLVELHYFQGMPFKEIAERFGRTDSRIAHIHADALQRLRERLDDGA